jgi:hypothetical protein
VRPLRLDGKFPLASNAEIFEHDVRDNPSFDALFIATNGRMSGLANWNLNVRRSPLLFSSPPGLSADPPWMKRAALGYSSDAVGTEVGFSMVRKSPFFSWTRGASITPTYMRKVKCEVICQRKIFTPLDVCGIHGLSPICMTRLVAEPDPTYIRSAVRDGGTNIPLAADKGSGGRNHSESAAFEAIWGFGSSTWIRQD